MIFAAVTFVPLNHNVLLESPHIPLSHYTNDNQQLE